jgi:Tfp pilus assembly protein PilF
LWHAFEPMKLARLGPAVTVIALCACAGKERRPTAPHEMRAPEIAKCVPPAAPASTTFEVDQLVGEQGEVPAAWIRAQTASNSESLLRCAARVATDAKYASQKVDWIRTSRISCGGAGCQRADPGDARSPLDEKLAQATLYVAGWATAAERGWAYLLVGNRGAALRELGQALKERPGDVRALRGMAVALIDSGGDLSRAREAAQKAVQLRPDTVATHETLLRVCLAQKDDRCAASEYDAARKAPDAEARAADLAPLEEPAKAAAERVAAAAKQDEERRAAEAEERLQKIDPAGCRKLEANSDAQLVCLVKRCFEAGAQQYAKELHTADGQPYAPGEWKVASRNGDTAEVTVPLRPDPAARKRRKRKTSGGEVAEVHDATWRATIGENITLVPLTGDAANVARKSDSCR